MSKPFAIVTGASSGIGLELAIICAQEGFDLLIAADRPEIHTAAQRIREFAAEGCCRRNRPRHVIDTNVTGTIYLVQLVGRDMRKRGQASFC